VGEEARRRRHAAAGRAHAGRAELSRFRSALVAHLDAAAARKKEPGKFVLHRLNRTEYANAVRDLLGVTIDPTDLLPSDGGEFGFDNVATALKTSPLMLERYVAAGLQVATLAVGDATAEPGTATYTISTVVSQDQHVEGLPLGTRGGILVEHTFPADGEYVFSGRLLKTVAEGLSGVEGHETPHNFVVTIDGKPVFTAPIGGKADHDAAKENTPVPREEFNKRMTSPRVKVTAGLHDVGFTFVERPQQEQNMWQPVLRATQEAHNPSGMPRLRNGIIEGPVRRHRRGQLRVAPASVRLHAEDGRAGSAVRRPHPVDGGAPRLPPSTGEGRYRRGAHDLSRRAERRRRLRRGHPLGARARAHQPAFSSVPSTTPPTCRTARRTRSRTSTWRAASPSSCGAAFRTTSC
jgi:hypothetical protein